MDVRWTLEQRCVLADTKRCFDVNTTSFERYKRRVLANTKRLFRCQYNIIRMLWMSDRR